jgi:hypothetical protein
MGGNTTTSRAVVQNAGPAYRLPAAAVKEEFKEAPVLHLLLHLFQPGIRRRVIDDDEFAHIRASVVISVCVRAPSSSRCGDMGCSPASAVARCVSPKSDIQTTAWSTSSSSSLPGGAPPQGRLIAKGRHHAKVPMVEKPLGARRRSSTSRERGLSDFTSGPFERRAARERAASIAQLSRQESATKKCMQRRICMPCRDVCSLSPIEKRVERLVSTSSRRIRTLQCLNGTAVTR